MGGLEIHVMKNVRGDVAGKVVHRVKTDDLNITRSNTFGPDSLLGLEKRRE
jgi:hypothetical protein